MASFEIAKARQRWIRLAATTRTKAIRETGEWETVAKDKKGARKARAALNDLFKSLYGEENQQSQTVRAYMAEWLATTDWPIVVVDVNDQGQIIGVEYVGVKQFGFETFMRLLRERVRRAFGVEIAEQEAESFMSFMRTPEAELALTS